MNYITIILIAIGLAMDAFAVSISSGLVIKHHPARNALRMALLFGGFQALMPIIGWLASYNFSEFISNIDHWIAFCLLWFIGFKMIFESMKRDKNKTESELMNSYVLLTMAIATSIDALAVGVSFAFLNISIIIPVILIGITAFIFSYIGFLLGNRLSSVFESKVSIIGIIGGLILLGIGVKILFEHLG
jgi:putative Mn2+ efflux pump MntP